MNILIVEDDTLLAEFTKRSLKRAHHHVSVVHDGSAGFRRAVNGSYDAIILDVLLPGKDGLSLCNELRQLHIDTPIILMSSYSTEQTRVSGLDAGADDYIIKPFSNEELGARLRAITRRPSVVSQSALVLGDMRLDPVGHTVYRDDIELKLRPKEYDLLEFMMQNPDIALSRHTLLKRVWGVYSNAASNRLEVYIRQLRKKIDDSFDKKYIKTVRGVGYKFSVK